MVVTVTPIIVTVTVVVTPVATVVVTVVTVVTVVVTAVVSVVSVRGDWRAHDYSSGWWGCGLWAGRAVRVSPDVVARTHPHGSRSDGAVATTRCRDGATNQDKSAKASCDRQAGGGAGSGASGVNWGATSQRGQSGVEYRSCW